MLADEREARRDAEQISVDLQPELQVPPVYLGGHEGGRQLGVPASYELDATIRYQTPCRRDPARVVRLDPLERPSRSLYPDPDPASVSDAEHRPIAALDDQRLPIFLQRRERQIEMEHADEQRLSRIGPRRLRRAGRAGGASHDSQGTLLASMTIPYGRHKLDDDDIQAVVDVLRGDWLTQGPAVAEFERAVAEACEVPFAVAYSSGTAALHAAAFAAGVGRGDELVTSAITFAASANCGAYLGAVPRFADIDGDTLNVTADTILGATSHRTRVVVPVHFAGLPAPVAEIREAVGPDVRIIEDAAHALGACTPDEPVGACRHSDMAVFSFHPVKAIACGEGGMVTTRNPDIHDRLQLFRTHGITKDPARLSHDNEGAWYQEQVVLGFNYRLSDIHSALGRSQLDKLARFIAERNQIADRYRQELGDLEQLVLPPAAPPGFRHAYHLFVIRHRGGAQARRRLFDRLRERDIYVQVHYLPVYRHPFYQTTYGYEGGLCPEAERYYSECVSLPCYPGLTPDQQDYVVATLRELAA